MARKSNWVEPKGMAAQSIQAKWRAVGSDYQEEMPAASQHGQACAVVAWTLRVATVGEKDTEFDGWRRKRALARL